MSFLGDIFFGKEAKPDYEAIERLMKLEAELNRTDRIGPFGGWTWDDEKGVQSYQVSEGVQPGFDRLEGRARGEGFSDYERDAGFGDLMKQKLATQKARMGIGRDFGEAPEEPPTQGQPVLPPNVGQPGPVPEPAPPVAGPGPSEPGAGIPGDAPQFKPLAQPGAMPAAVQQLAGAAQGAPQPKAPPGGWSQVQKLMKGML